MQDTTRDDLMQRSADARAVVTFDPSDLAELQKREEFSVSLRHAAATAASLAAKRYATVFENAHQVLLDAVQCRITTDTGSIHIEVGLQALAKTDVSAVALYAASCAALSVLGTMEGRTLKGIALHVELLESTGGRRSEPVSLGKNLSAGVIVLSDTRAAGRMKDDSGPAARDHLEGYGIRVAEYAVIPDDADALAKLLTEFADKKHLDIVVTSGGTGLGPRDVTPDVTSKLIDREVPGISEAIRQYGQRRTPFSMLSRATAGLRGSTLLLNLPGSPAGVRESLDAVFPEVLHVFKMLQGGGHG